MKKPEFWTASFTGVLAVVTLGTVIYGGIQLSDARKEARIQHLLTLEKEFQESPLAGFRSKVGSQRLAGKDHGNELYPILNFFDTVGLLVHRGYLDDEDVWETFSYWILNYYADNAEEIAQMQRDDPNTYAEYSYLVNRMQKIDEGRR